MKKTFIRFSATVMASTFLFACQKEMSNKAKADLSGTEISAKKTVTIASSCGQLSTYTQGGWGASPAGNNPGTYLHANFQSAFGEYLTVGCPDKFFVKLTSAQAITNLLPAGGKGAALTASYTDPASLKNVLVGQLVALKLSVGFDYADDNFGQSPVALGDMIIASGPFKGNTVSDFLALAEEVLGGCSKDFSADQIVETATSINENFDNGTTDKGFLTCPNDDGGGDNGGGGGNPA
ncbi:hypothetical protein A4H97_33155 [Niastella yeongjuensis]|uniref:Uncharacterized protein n=1 Tax=Niastella yeongjuensis TaxID=354355 RepID=A0A1V9EFX6_9BACT|nr:hypothetical protein [Niastella yeongjuensis]OQP45013.1 hypothetical protein A4H97_33155 [Niastella yeongjuensis]SEP49065.1 hypothetical protein SAMN05660816_06880 [Niastella yeongjuensis]